MLRFLSAFLALGVAARAAERTFDFSQCKENEIPKGFRSTVSGEGKPGEWKVILDELPSALPALSAKSPVLTKQAVLAQLSRDPTDEHFPLLVFDEESYSDFTFRTRLKTVSGEAEQMAGVAFRLQDEKNYYVIRLSSLGHNIRFYKFVNGLRSAPIGPELEVPRGVWHDLSIECKGNQIRCALNGKEAIPPLTDTSFTAGKLGFWTKSDSVSYFVGAKVAYTLRERFADTLVQDTIKKYSKLHNLKLYAVPQGQAEPRVIAATWPSEVGQPGEKPEKDCLERGLIFTGKRKSSVVVLMPLKDRNGDVVAAAKLVMDTFLGQTEKNMVARALPVIRFMEDRIVHSNEPLE